MMHCEFTAPAALPLPAVAHDAPDCRYLRKEGSDKLKKFKLRYFVLWTDFPAVSYPSLKSVCSVNRHKLRTA